MLYCLREVVFIGTKEFNKRAYDQRLIRFPKGTLLRFHELFKDVSFNAWVVQLVTSRLLVYEEKQETKPPDM